MFLSPETVVQRTIWRSPMIHQPSTQPLVIVYGLSGTGKTRFVLSQSVLFDRPDVAIHGHPKEYAEFRQAHRFGYERGAVGSERKSFDAALADPGIRLLVIDEADQASEAFGRDWARRMAEAGKAGLLLVQTLEEAVETAAGLAARNGRLYWDDIPLESCRRPGTKAAPAREAGVVLMPVGWPALAAFCGALWKQHPVLADRDSGETGDWR
jgi:hypothetical protein